MNSEMIPSTGRKGTRALSLGQQSPALSLPEHKLSLLPYIQQHVQP
jgi:hypothetical protein